MVQSSGEFKKRPISATALWEGRTVIDHISRVKPRTYIEGPEGRPTFILHRKNIFNRYDGCVEPFPWLNRPLHD
jgi:hypothetical protein